MTSKFDGLVVEPIELEGQKFDNCLEQDVAINTADLDSEFCNQTERFAWWAFLSELAKDLVARKKNELRILYAQLDYKSRAEAVVRNVKLTEKMVENQVVTHQDYQQCTVELIHAQKVHGILTAGKESLAQRKDMLISLGANLRAGSNPDLISLIEGAKATAAAKAQEKANKRALEASQEEEKKTIDAPPTPVQKGVGKQVGKQVGKTPL